MIKTRNEFLSLLESRLAPLPPEEREELMEDYKTHFAFGLAGGKTESEIVAELGDPDEIAKEALGQRPVPEDKDPVYWYYGGEDSEQEAYDAHGFQNVHGTSGPHGFQSVHGASGAPGSPSIHGAPDAHGFQSSPGAYGAPGASFERGQSFAQTASGDFPGQARRRRSVLGSIAVITGLFFMNLVAVPVLVSFWSVLAGLAAGAAGGILSPIMLLLDYLQKGTFFPAKGFAAVTLVGIGILLLLLTRVFYLGLLKLTTNYAGWNFRLARGKVKYD